MKECEIFKRGDVDMDKMNTSDHHDNLYHSLQPLFPEGLKYAEAVQLCIIFFSIKVPSLPMLTLTKEELGDLFAYLVDKSFIRVDPGDLEAISKRLLIRNIDPKDSGHWIDVCLSILRAGAKANDQEIEERLLVTLGFPLATAKDYSRKHAAS